MGLPSKDNEQFSIAADQTRDLFVRKIVGAGITFRLLVQRSKESQEQHLPGEDYALVVGNRSGSSLCFCLCDGVGSSYKGSFAARYLARHLVRWLHRLPAIHLKEAALTEPFKAALASWASPGQAILRRLPFAPDAPELVREVLEEVREHFGSETVFFAGRLDAADPSAALSVTTEVDLLVCWMGNLVGKLEMAHDPPIHLGDSTDDYHRWSTCRGVRGVPTLRILPALSLKRLIVYTDGADVIASDITSLSDLELQARAWETLALPTSDDLTVFDLKVMDAPVQQGTC